MPDVVKIVTKCLFFYCEGCEEVHCIPLSDKPWNTNFAGYGDDNWAWNGSFDKPTLEPCCHAPSTRHKCNFKIKKGVIDYYIHSTTHDLRGRQRPLLPVHKWPTGRMPVKQKIKKFWLTQRLTDFVKKILD